MRHFVKQSLKPVFTLSNPTSTRRSKTRFFLKILSLFAAYLLVNFFNIELWLVRLLVFSRANVAFKFVIFLYFAKYNGKLAVRNVFVCESFRDQVADRVLLGHCECINLFMFRDFFSSLLLNVVKLEAMTMAHRRHFLLHHQIPIIQHII